MFNENLFNLNHIKFLLVRYWYCQRGHLIFMFKNKCVSSTSIINWVILDVLTMSFIDSINNSGPKILGDTISYKWQCQGSHRLAKKNSRTFQGLSWPLFNIFRDQLSTLFKTAIYVADTQKSLTAKEIGSGVSRNVDREGSQSDPRNIGEGVAGRGLGRGFSWPDNGSPGCNLRKIVRQLTRVLTPILWLNLFH